MILPKLPGLFTEHGMAGSELLGLGLLTILFPRPPGDQCLGSDVPTFFVFPPHAVFPILRIRSDYDSH